MSEITVPYLAEHQASDNPFGGKAGYNPSSEDKEKLQLIDSLYSKSKKFRKRYDQKWIDFYKMFRGRQWKEVRPSYRNSEVLNLVFQTIQSMVPILTDSRPQIEFLPTIATQTELADILTKVAANDWEHNNWLMTLVEMILDAHIYGDGFAYVGYNPKAEMGLGCIEFESQDNFYFFMDPNARDINGKRTRYVITAEPTDISILKKEYPDQAEFISADVIDFSQADKADIYQVMFKSPVDSKLIVEGPSGYDSLSKNQALKITIYSKDDSFEEEEKTELHEDGTPQLDENGSEKKSYVQKLKYPKGRKLCAAGGVLLDDREFEFDDGLFPFIQFRNYPLPREPYSIGEVDQLDSPQKTINKLISFTLDVMSLMGNPIWIVDDASGIDTDNLTNQPGLIIEKSAGSEVRREGGTEIPGYILPFLDRYKQYFDGISGQTDLSRGVEPSDVSSGVGISALQEAQQTRLRQKSRNLDAALKDFGRLYLSRAFQFYSVPRIVRISGNQNADRYFYFHVESLTADPTTQEPYLDKEGSPVTKKFANIVDEAGQRKVIEIQGDFDVRVSTGTSLPFAKQQQGAQSMNLFKLGVIDDEELLKDLNYPNYESVLNRVNQKKQAATQQQMQTQQQNMMTQIAGKQAIKATPVVQSIPPPLGAGPQNAPSP